MIINIILLFVGLVFLVKFSNFTIKNAVKFSYLTGISNMTIGFIIIAILTSLPEFTIGIISSFKGEGLLSIGNIIGANISNLALILGIVSLVGFHFKKNDAIQTQKILIVTTIIAVFMLILRTVNYVFGIFLLIMFYIFSKALIKDGIKVKERVGGLRSIESAKTLLYLIVSVTFVIVSAKIVTDSSISLAYGIGVAESVIGATILSIGTTMPELSIALAAVRKKNIELAIGDTIGSILANLTLVLGAVTLINPIITGYIEIAGFVMLILINLLFLFLTTQKSFGKNEGILLMATYAVYLSAMLYLGAL